MNIYPFKKKNSMKGKFITFEGIEGTGKTTQIRILSSYLEDKMYEVVLTREPGGTKICDGIRSILLNPDHQGMDTETELLLYYASRAELVSKVIKPAVDENKIILCDRFYDSSIAYQHYGRGLKRDLLEVLTDKFVKVHPDLTILIDTPVEIGFARMSVSEFEKPDRIESESREFHERVRQGYLDLASKHSERIKVIDGTFDKETVSKNIVEYVNNILER